MSDTTRVTMVWPADLKEQVREKVGARGLTEFTLSAVRVKLGEPEPTVDEAQLNEAQEVAQRLADALAMGNDYEDRQSQLRLMELPSWITTEGWPDDLAATVPLEESVAEPVITRSGPDLATFPEEGPSGLYVDDDDQANEADEAEVEIPQHPTDSDLHKPMFMTGRDQGVTDVPTPPSGKADDLMERIRAKAAEKGIDMSGVDLKAASDVPQPPVQEHEQAEDVSEVQSDLAPEPEVPTEPALDLEVQADAPTQVAPSVCGDCGGELVDGECWTCF